MCDVTRDLPTLPFCKLPHFLRLLPPLEREVLYARPQNIYNSSAADRCDLLIPWSHTSLSQNRAFAVVGPTLWNDSPPALRSVMLQGISSASLRSLKTFIFTSLSR